MKNQLDVLQAAIDAETDEAAKAELQAQYDALKLKYDSAVESLAAAENAFAQKESEIKVRLRFFRHRKK